MISGHAWYETNTKTQNKTKNVASLVAARDGERPWSQKSTARQPVILFLGSVYIKFNTPALPKSHPGRFMFGILEDEHERSSILGAPPRLRPAPHRLAPPCSAQTRLASPRPAPPPRSPPPESAPPRPVPPDGCPGFGFGMLNPEPGHTVGGSNGAVHGGAAVAGQRRADGTPTDRFAQNTIDLHPPDDRTKL